MGGKLSCVVHAKWVVGCCHHFLPSMAPLAGTRAPGRAYPGGGNTSVVELKSWPRADTVVPVVDTCNRGGQHEDSGFSGRTGVDLTCHKTLSIISKCGHLRLYIIDVKEIHLQYSPDRRTF